MMGGGTADGRQRDGEHTAVGRCDELSEAESDASLTMTEDVNSQRFQANAKGGVGSLHGPDATTSSCDTVGVPDSTSDMGRKELFRAGGNDQMESSLVAGSIAQNTAAESPGQSNSEADVGEAFNFLFTNAMKLQLKAQILVLGDLLKGIAPSSDLLEEACSEHAVGAEAVLLEPIDAQCGVQDVQRKNMCSFDTSTEPNLRSLSAAFKNADPRMSPFSGSADPPTTAVATEALRAPGGLSTPGEPSSSGKEFLFRDGSIAREKDVAPSGHLMITHDRTATARSNSNVAGDTSQATEVRGYDDDRHLDLAQASAQDALTTATSALAQSHMVWARLHSQDHTEEGAARDARIASVAATVAAAASVAKAAVEAARAIAEVSMDAFIQAAGYQAGDTGTRITEVGSKKFSKSQQMASGDQSPHGGNRENATPSQQRADMVESVVQAAGKAAEAASQAGAVLAHANPLMNSSNLCGFWPRRQSEADAEHERSEYGQMIEVNAMDAVNEVDEFDRGHGVDALNEMDVDNEADGANEEDAVEEMDNMHEENYGYQKELGAAIEMNDVYEENNAYQDEAHELNEDEDQVPAENVHAGEVAAVNDDRDEEVIADEEQVSAAHEDQEGVVVPNVDELIEVAGVNEVVEQNDVAAANEREMAAANEVDVPKEVAEPVEEGKRNNSRSRKSKKGRRRYFGVPKRFKKSVEVSSATALAPTSENAGQKRDTAPKRRKDVRDEITGGTESGAKRMEIMAVSGLEDTTERDLGEPGSARNTQGVSEKIAEGSAVEVMTDEIGLRGAWFSGEVIRVTLNEAFVKLDDLLTDDGKANVREWFPLVQGCNPNPSLRHVRPVHPFSIVSDAGSRKRRRVALGSQTWNIGDHVDAFVQDAWWEGVVAELNDLDATKATIYFPGENDTQVVKTWDLRPSFQWKDNKWMPWKSPELLEPNERPQKRQNRGSPKNKKPMKDDTDALIPEKSNAESSGRRTERTKLQGDSRPMPEPTSTTRHTRQSAVKEQQEIKTLGELSRQKKSSNKKLSNNQIGGSTSKTRKAYQKDALPPETVTKKLEFNMDAITPAASVKKIDAAQGKTPVSSVKKIDAAQGKTPVSRGNLKHRRK